MTGKPHDDAQDLALVEKLLTSQTAVHLERLPEANDSKSPDFAIRNRDGHLVGYCEVKSTSDPWLDEELAEVPVGEVAGGARPDPVFNRIGKCVQKAIKQFDAVNPEGRQLNVLAIVNYDDMSNAADLLEVLTGEFHAEGGKRFPTMKKVSEGAIRDIKKRIDLYIWIDGRKQRVELWFLGNIDCEAEACAAFNLDPGKIKR